MDILGFRISACDRFRNDAESRLLVAISEAMTIYLIASGLRPGGAYDPEGACSYRNDVN